MRVDHKQILRFAQDDGGGVQFNKPTPGTARPYHFPRFTRTTLSNGLRVIVAPVRDLPLVTLHAFVDAGATHDPRGQEGVALLTAALMGEGTLAHDGAALADRFERLGTTLEVGADWDSAALEVTGLSERFEAFVALLSEVLRTPAFAEREVARLRGERLAELLEQRAEPRGLADDMFARFAYAEGARYGMPAGGNEASVGALTRDAFVAFHAARYTPSTTTLIIAGDIDADAALCAVVAQLGDWSAQPTTTADGRAPDAPSTVARGIDLIVKPDAPQSELRVGHVAIARGNPAWLRVHVMNAILGGLFSSRINLNLREKNAYTYGAFSSVDARRHAGCFEVSTAVQSDVTAPALREIFAEITGITQGEVSADELSLATAYLEGVFPIRFETTSAVAGALANLVIFGLADDYYDTYRASVRGMTTADVLAGARTLLRPAELRIVVVGDPAQVREALAGLELGPVREWDPTGAPATDRMKSE